MDWFLYDRYLCHERVKEALSSLTWNNLNMIILAQLNINSTQNKFNLLSDWVTGNVDVFMISEIERMTNLHRKISFIKISNYFLQVPVLLTSHKFYELQQIQRSSKPLRGTLIKRCSGN